MTWDIPDGGSVAKGVIDTMFMVERGIVAGAGGAVLGNAGLRTRVPSTKLAQFGMMILLIGLLVEETLRIMEWIVVGAIENEREKKQFAA